MTINRRDFLKSSLFSALALISVPKLITDPYLLDYIDEKWHNLGKLDIVYKGPSTSLIAKLDSITVMLDRITMQHSTEINIQGNVDHFEAANGEIRKFPYGNVPLDSGDRLITHWHLVPLNGDLSKFRIPKEWNADDLRGLSNG